jgi:hypothetical protein
MPARAFSQAIYLPPVEPQANIKLYVEKMFGSQQKEGKNQGKMLRERKPSKEMQNT